MKNDIKKLFNLQNIWADGYEVMENEIIVKVRNPRTFALCPRCASSTKKIHQYHNRILKHGIFENRRIIIDLTERRFCCRKCHKVFTEKIMGIDRRRTTGNFRNDLLKKMSRNSLSYARENLKVSSSVLYSSLKENKERLNVIDWKKQGRNITVGIDEHSFRGKKMALTITNISKNRLLAVKENDKVETVEKFLFLADKKRVSEVCIDMKTGFLNAVRRQLPDAKVTVDKFHVIAYANRMLDEERSIIVGRYYRSKRILLKGKERLNDREKEKLMVLFERYKNFPSLSQAYMIKEKLRDFYRLEDKKEAKGKLDQVIILCESSNSYYIKNFGKTLIRWKEYILNYFDNYSTNAFTEGCHTKIKMIKRMSFGFRNVENYISKIMLAFVPLLWLSRHTV